MTEGLSPDRQTPPPRMAAHWYYGNILYEYNTLSTPWRGDVLHLPTQVEYVQDESLVLLCTWYKMLLIICCVFCCVFLYLKVTYHGMTSSFCYSQYLEFVS
jgi:hypothetical protein